MRLKPIWIPASLTFLGTSLLFKPHGQSRVPGAGKPPRIAHATLSQSYDKLPLRFEVNQGQTDKRVKFVSRGRGYTLFLTPTESVLALAKPERQASETGRSRFSKKNRQTVNALRVKFVGANPVPRVETMDELPSKANYFIADDPKKWGTNVATFAKVKYHDVYPGVGLLYRLKNIFEGEIS